MDIYLQLFTYVFLKKGELAVYSSNIKARQYLFKIGGYTLPVE
jgi:hypothetical protein